MAGTVREWSVTLEAITERGAVLSDRLFDLVELLESNHAGAASLSPDGTRVEVSLWMEASNPGQALAGAERAFLTALQQLGLAGFQVVEVEIKPWERLEKALKRRNFPDLVGVAELAEILNVSRQRVSELAGTSHFPRPLAELKAGPVWDRSAIGNFLKAWRRTPGRPPKGVSASGASRARRTPILPEASGQR